MREVSKGTRVSHYFVVPRDKGGFVVIAVGAGRATQGSKNLQRVKRTSAICAKWRGRLRIKDFRAPQETYGDLRGCQASAVKTGNSSATVWRRVATLAGCGRDGVFDGLAHKASQLVGIGGLGVA
jgi:hypothetical protein